MAKIEDLRKIKFDKIPKTYGSLSTGIRQLIADYDSEDDKPFFEKEAHENINAYYDMVKSVAPEAVGLSGKAEEKSAPKRKTPITKGKEKNRQIVFEHYNALLDLAVNYGAEESDELEGQFKNTLDALNAIYEDEAEKQIPEAFQKVIKPFYAHAEMLEQNQRTRLGSVNEVDVQYRDSAVKIVDQLLKKLGLEKKVEKKKEPTKKKPDPKSQEELEKIAKEVAVKSKRVMTKMEEYEANIAACRTAIREHNKKKRESAPPKPKPTRRTVLKKRVLSLVKLTPEAISGNEQVQAENRKIVKATIRAFMKNWGMNQAKQVETKVDKELDEIEEKIESKEAKETAQKWSRELPATDKIIAHEKKHNKHLMEEAALQIVDQITEAIKLYREEKETAFEFLRSNFNTRQLKEYLPKYIIDEMKAKANT